MKAPSSFSLLAAAGLVALACGAPIVSADEVKTPLYTVVDGNKVDAKTLQGFRQWRQSACDRCHGANQEGLVGPSLIEGLKKLTKDEFVATVTKGRLEKGMPSFGSSEAFVANVDNLYAYLKGRSDGAITSSRVTGIE